MEQHKAYHGFTILTSLLMNSKNMSLYEVISSSRMGETRSLWRIENFRLSNNAFELANELY